MQRALGRCARPSSISPCLTHLLGSARAQYPQRSSTFGALTAFLHDCLLPLIGHAEVQGREEQRPAPAQPRAAAEAALSRDGSLGRVGSSSLLLGHSQRHEPGAAPAVGTLKPLYSMPKALRPAREAPQESAPDRDSPTAASDSGAQTPSPPTSHLRYSPSGPAHERAKTRPLRWRDPPAVPSSRLRRPPPVFTSGTTLHPPTEQWAAQVRSYYQPSPLHSAGRPTLPRAEGVSGTGPTGPWGWDRGEHGDRGHGTPSLHTTGYVQRLYAPPLDLARDPLPTTAGSVQHANDPKPAPVGAQRETVTEGAHPGSAREQHKQPRRQQRQQRSAEGRRRSGRRPTSPWGQRLALESPTGSSAKVPTLTRGRRRPPSAKLGAWETEPGAVEHGLGGRAAPAASLEAAEEALRQHARRRGDEAAPDPSSLRSAPRFRRAEPDPGAVAIPATRAVAGRGLAPPSAAGPPSPRAAPNASPSVRSPARSRTRTRTRARTRARHASRTRPRTAAGSPPRVSASSLQPGAGAEGSPIVVAHSVGPVRSTSATQRPAGPRSDLPPSYTPPRPSGSSKSAAGHSAGARAPRRGPSFAAFTAALHGAPRSTPPRHSRSAITLLAGSGLGGGGQQVSAAGPVLSTPASAARMRQGRPQAVDGASHVAPQLASEVADVALRAEGQAKRLLGTERSLEETRRELKRTWSAFLMRSRGGVGPAAE